jgi:hypothetical protein
MDASPLDAAKKRSAAAREFAAVSRANRPLAASRWAPALPSFALAVAALAACGGKEDVGPELSRQVAVRASDGTKTTAPAAGTPWRAGDEPSMAGLATPTLGAGSAASVASTAPPPLAPSTLPIRTAGEMAPISTVAPVASAPAIAPSHYPPTVKGKMAIVRPAPLGTRSIDDEPASPVGSPAPCPNPKGNAAP